MSHPAFAGRTPAQTLAYGLLLVLLGIAAARLVTGADLALRVGLLRTWSLFSAGAFATMLPHVLLPDDRLPLYQLLNRSPAQLLGDQLGRWSAVLLLFAAPAAVLAFYDPGGWMRDGAAKTLMLGQNLLAIVGMSGYSLARYMAMGATLQDWHEGRAGQRYRTMKGETGVGFDLPPGLVPTLFATARIMMVAFTVVIVAAVLRTSVGAMTALLPGLVLSASVGLQLLRRRSAFDRAYYSTNAVYGELLGGGDGYAEAREPVTMAALYWVPSRWRPATWANLRQLDRVLPLGRFVVLGHLLLWVLAARGMGAPIIAGYLLLFIIAQNGACALLVRRRAAPSGFQLAMQSVFDWVMTRFFVNLRWTLPFGLSLTVIALFDAGFGFRDVLFWTGLDVGAALGAAGLATYSAERTTRRRYT